MCIRDRGWRTYFDMDTDYEAVKRSVDPEDEYLQAAMAFGGGVRILRQDLWEMIVTFLISQNNNISRIRNSVDALCEKFGTRKTGTGLVLDLSLIHILNLQEEYFMKKFIKKITHTAKSAVTLSLIHI